ncbi:helix-turn-helix transcriptional regulator [Ktedonobacteria bacterium brp13]|nr:helix-turn-helix transcriptional regulator [Ktedonobacteria bacterium brp13]
MIYLKIKEVAEAKGMSQGKLSRAADVDPKTLRDIFRDPGRSITTETLNRLAGALGVDARELIDYVPDDNKKEALP